MLFLIKKSYKINIGIDNKLITSVFPFSLSKRCLKLSEFLDLIFILNFD